MALSAPAGYACPLVLFPPFFFPAATFCHVGVHSPYFLVRDRGHRQYVYMNIYARVHVDTYGESPGSPACVRWYPVDVERCARQPSWHVRSTRHTKIARGLELLTRRITRRALPIALLVGMPGL